MIWRSGSAGIVGPAAYRAPRAIVLTDHGRTDGHGCTHRPWCRLEDRPVTGSDSDSSVSRPAGDLHAIGEICQYTGHADIVREAIDGA